MFELEDLRVKDGVGGTDFKVTIKKCVDETTFEGDRNKAIKFGEKSCESRFPVYRSGKAVGPVDQDI